MDGLDVEDIALGRGQRLLFTAYFLVRGRNPALRSASSLAVDDPVLAPVVLVAGVVTVVVGAAAPPPVVLAGAIVVGVPGVTAAPVLAGVVVPGVSVVGVPGVTAPVVVGIVPATVGVVVATVIVVVMGATGFAVVFEPPLRSTSAAASTPSARAATTAIVMIGAFQLVGAASRVRAAAPQCRHHSCPGSRGAPHNGQAASTGGPGLVVGVVDGGGAATVLKDFFWRVDE
jgi:hypothetical protein